MPRSETLSNPGTSSVFLCLVRGITYPKAIADFLGIKPPPVIQQLRRLRKIDIVALGEKVGKEQNYDIKWQTFLGVFLENAVQNRKKGKDVLIRPQEYDKNTDEINSLKQNKYFMEFVKNYLRNVAKDDVSRWKTLREIIADVERIIPHFSSLKEERVFQDAKRQEFYYKMRIWYTRITTVQTWTELHIHDALQKTLNPDSDNLAKL